MAASFVVRRPRGRVAGTPRRGITAARRAGWVAGGAISATGVAQEAYSSPSRGAARRHGHGSAARGMGRGRCRQRDGGSSGGQLVDRRTWRRSSSVVRRAGWRDGAARAPSRGAASRQRNARDGAGAVPPAAGATGVAQEGDRGGSGGRASGSVWGRRVRRTAAAGPGGGVQVQRF